MDQTQLTPKQQELLEFIDEFIQTNNYSPSYREIASVLGYNSVATVAEHVNNLVTLGVLRKASYSARSLEVVKQTESQEVSLVNQIKLRYQQLTPVDQKKVKQAIEILDIQQLKEITG